MEPKPSSPRCCCFRPCQAIVDERPRGRATPGRGSRVRPAESLSRARENSQQSEQTRGSTGRGHIPCSPTTLSACTRPAEFCVKKYSTWARTRKDQERMAGQTKASLLTRSPGDKQRKPCDCSIPVKCTKTDRRRSPLALAPRRREAESRLTVSSDFFGPVIDDVAKAL